MGRYIKTGLFLGTVGAGQMSFENYETDEEVQNIEKTLMKNSGLSLVNDNLSYNKAKSRTVDKDEKLNDYKMDGHGSAPTKGKPNSVTKVYRDGKLEQERYYDKNGDVYLDIDYTNHGNPKQHPIVPHQHRWIRDEKGNLNRDTWEKVNK